MHQQDLIDGIKNGNNNAIRELIDTYSDYIYSLSFKTLSNRADAEEVVNDVFLKIINKIGDLQEGSSIKSWMYAITYRTCIDKIRSRKTYSEIDLASDTIGHNDIDAKMEAKENTNLIKKLLAYLPSEDALLMRMYYLEECKIKEVAEATGLSEENIKTKLFRSRKILSQKVSLVR